MQKMHIMQTVKIAKNAVNSVSSIKCDTIILDRESKSDTIPTNIVDNNSSYLEHEATVSKIEEDKLFYLMSRGISFEDANRLLLNGFLINSDSIEKDKIKLFLDEIEKI